MEVRITNLEILDRPNDLELGKYVREKYWKTSEELFKNNSDEHMQLEVNVDGVVVGVRESSEDEYDSCLICGRRSQYLKTTHVDFRKGYISGAGQGCDGSCRI